MKIITLAVLLLVAHGLAWGGFYEGLAAAQRGDYKVALREWQPLANNGDAQAQYHLGVMYHNGFGIPQDYGEAMKWYRKAARQGLAAAQYNLGVIYHNGGGVTQDYVQAYMWFNIASANGVVQAKRNQEIAATNMTPGQIAEAQNLAQKWMEKHP